MSTKRTNFELLHCKDRYNRMSLQIKWAHSRKRGAIKFDRLRLDFEDLRSDYLLEKRKFLSEGFKI